ncbi:AMP-binding protein [Streptomyces sp. NPDC002851]
MRDLLARGCPVRRRPHRPHLDLRPAPGRRRARRVLAGCTVPGAAAQIQYTSGTSGIPKGAVLHHRGLVANATFVAARAGFSRDGVWGSALPLFHAADCDLTVLGVATATGTLVLARVFPPRPAPTQRPRHVADRRSAPVADRGQDRRPRRSRSAARGRAG